MKTRSRTKQTKSTESNIKPSKLQKAVKKTPESISIAKTSSKPTSSKALRKSKIPNSQQVNNSDLLSAPVRLNKLKSRTNNIKSSLLDSQPNLDEESKTYVVTKDMYGKPKPFTKHDSKVAKLTKWIDVTILELHHILAEESKHHKDIEEEEICAICRCELYDDILKMSLNEIKEKEAEQLTNPDQIEVVKFKDCADHFYHKACCEGMLAGKEYIKCAVCSKIYGEYVGDCPPGKMKWKYHKKGTLPLESYEDQASWMISYFFLDGIKNGVNYRGTRRNAYLPDTKEGREVLLLLIKSFQRKHTFTVGDSVTTGRTNVVVWNSIHHKTSTHGGTLCFGYPDPTYFNRVKLELANKGVVLEPNDDTDKINKNGTIFIK